MGSLSRSLIAQLIDKDSLICVIPLIRDSDSFSTASSRTKIALETQRSVKFQSADGVRIAAMSSGNFTSFLRSKSSTFL